MPTLPVRKFALSLSDDELLGFSEGLEYFVSELTALGFDRQDTYRFRYQDRECVITAELTGDEDDTVVWLIVQAAELHLFRVEEIANSLNAFILLATKPVAFNTDAERPRPTCVLSTRSTESPQQLLAYQHTQ